MIAQVGNKFSIFMYHKGLELCPKYPDTGHYPEQNKDSLQPTSSSSMP